MAGQGPPFDAQEYRTRLACTKDRMLDANIDVLFCSDPANMNYLAGYDGWSFYVHQGLIVSRDHDQPVWVGRDMDAYYYTTRAHQRLQARLPDAEFTNADLLVNWVRCVKSDAEIEYMTETAQISEAAMQAGIDTIEEGVMEAGAAEIYHTLIDGTEAFGGDYPSIVPLMPSGNHTGTPRLTWSDREFRQGDPVIIELGGCRHRYHAPLARTTFVGDPPSEVQETAAIVVEISESFKVTKGGCKTFGNFPRKLFTS